MQAPDDLSAPGEPAGLAAPATAPAPAAALGAMQPEGPPQWVEQGSTPDCPFTLRVAGDLIPVARASEQPTRYILAAHTEEERRRLAPLLAAHVAAPFRDLTQSMPLLLGSMTRAELQWLCADPAAAPLVRYVERDEKVSVLDGGGSSGEAGGGGGGRVGIAALPSR